MTAQVLTLKHYFLVTDDLARQLSKQKWWHKTHNPSTWEAEGTHSPVPGKAGLPSKTLSQRLTNIYKQIYTFLSKCKSVVLIQRQKDCKNQRITEFSVRLCLLATSEAKLPNMSWVRKTQMLSWAGESPQPCTKSFWQPCKLGVVVVVFPWEEDPNWLPVPNSHPWTYTSK